MPNLGAQQPRWTCPTVAAAAGHMPIVLIGTGSGLDMSNGWLGGHCCNFPDVGAWIPETGRSESRSRFIGPLRNPTPRREPEGGGASSSKGNWSPNASW